MKLRREVVLRLDGSWTAVQGVQNVLLRGSGVRYVVENSDPKCALEKKRLRIDVTKEEDHTGLRKIHLDRSGPKLNKIQARLELPTPASSTPEISIVAPTECGVVAWLFTAKLLGVTTSRATSVDRKNDPNMNGQR